MVYTVTFNPALDYVVTLDELKVGGLNRTRDEQILAGGKGINVSIVLKNMAIDNIALGFIAGFTGRKIEAMLIEDGCSTDFIYVDEGMSRINIKVKSGNETEINGIGPSISGENIRELICKLDILKAGDILVLAGSIPNTLPTSIYKEIMEYLTGRNVKIVVDASGDLLLNVLEYKPFLVKPNKEELAQMFGKDIVSSEDVIFYGMKLKEAGAINVLVSMGPDGAILIDERGKIYENGAPVGEVINTVGAGDSMVAGFIAGYIEKQDYEYAFGMGIAAGSASAFSSFLATKEEIMEVYDKLYMVAEGSV